MSLGDGGCTLSKLSGEQGLGCDPSAALGSAQAWHCPRKLTDPHTTFAPRGVVGNPGGMLLLSWPFFSARDAPSASTCPKPLYAQKCCGSSIPLWLLNLFFLSPPSAVSPLRSLLFSAFPQTHPVLFMSHCTLLRKQKQQTKPDGPSSHVLPQKQGVHTEAPATTSFCEILPLLQAFLGNWCHQIKFIPQLGLVVSCSATDKIRGASSAPIKIARAGSCRTGLCLGSGISPLHNGIRPCCWDFSIIFLPSRMFSY